MFKCSLFGKKIIEIQKKNLRNEQKEIKWFTKNYANNKAS